MLEQASLESKAAAYKIGVSHMHDTSPAFVEAYHRFTGEAFREGALSEREKQLIGLGIAMFANNEVCTVYHVQEALSCGATTEQIAEAVAVAAAACSGHAVSQGATRVQAVLERQGKHRDRAPLQ